MRLPWTRWERRWRDALCRAMVAPGAGQPGLAGVDSAGFWDEYERSSPGMLGIGFRASVWALDLAPLLSRGRRFHRLPPAEQQAFLDRTAASRSYLVRQLPLTIKLMACFAYLHDPGVRDQLDAPLHR